jgi:tetratricopeptide (TPR) repeat protein
MRLRSTFLPLVVLLFNLQSPGDTFRRHHERAEAHRRAGNTPAAEAEYAAILAEAHHRLGRVNTARGEHAAAVASLEAAARYRPGSPEVLVDLAIAYFHAEQYGRAVEPLRAAVAREPRNPAARHMLGKSYFMLGEFPKAVVELGAALELSPDDYDAAYTLGLAHLKQRQFEPARAIYERMTGRLGDRPQLRVLVGRAYRETGFLAESIEEFRRAAALDPRFPRVHYYLGLTYLLKDGAARIEDAAREFRIELDANPEEYFANYYLGILYIIERKWEPAIALLEKAARIQPRNPDPYFHLGQAYQRTSRRRKPT